MRVVHHHDRAILFRHLAQPGQRPNIAIHRKHAVGDHQFPPRLILHAGQLLFGVRHIFVAENQDLRSRQPRSIDDRRMVQLIGDDEIFLAQQRRNRSRIRRESRLKHHARFHVLEARDLLFQLHVQRHRPGNRAHRARSHAVLLRRLQRRFAQLGMRRQPQVIVRRQVDHLLAVERALRRLLILEHPQTEVRAL